MPFGFTIRRIENFYYSQNLAVSTSPVQINGLNWPNQNTAPQQPQNPPALTGFSNPPPIQQQGLMVTNTSATAIMYVGTSSSITAIAAGGWIWQINPGGTEEIDCNSNCNLWAVGSAAGSVTVSPFQ